MNFWPYLRQREQEILERKSAVMNSLLFPVLRGSGDLIFARLWTSPDNEKQLTVALRFAVSPFFSYIMTMRPQIPVDATLVRAVHYDLCEKCSGKLALRRCDGC